MLLYRIRVKLKKGRKEGRNGGGKKEGRTDRVGCSVVFKIGYNYRYCYLFFYKEREEGRKEEKRTKKGREIERIEGRNNRKRRTEFQPLSDNM